MYGGIMKHTCEYGCSGEGFFFNEKSKKWCCLESVKKCPGVQEKKKQTLLKKYGVTNVSQMSDVQERKKKTWIEKYGVDNPSKAPAIAQKIKDKWEIIDAKRKVTMVDKYGVDSYNKTSEFSERRKVTWTEKYGVDNPTKNVDIFHKAFVSRAKSEYSTKTMTLPSGKTIRYQGFENLVIEDLLKAGIHEDDIITGPGNVPHIQYEFEGKICRYYPDIYLPKLNQIIEVKSLYTWTKYKQKNLAKYKATKEAGFKVNIVIKRKNGK